MQINSARLLQWLDELAEIGSIPGGGVCRLAFSKEDKAGRDYIERLMRQLGMQVQIDAVGNILGIRKGRHKDGPLVLTGSHTDTVGTGGRFDGSLGVLAGLEVIAQLNDAGVETEKPIGVISFVNEEGVRFMPDMMGSLYLKGELTLAEIRGVKGIDGTTIGENLDEQAYAGTEDFRNLEIAQFIELHIEQGPWLERENIEIGVVERVQGIRWLEFTFTGMANHAGATPMSMRHDAGYAAGVLAHAVRGMANEMGEGQRATVGSITLSPNLINVIAERAVVTVDLRNPITDKLIEAEQRVLAEVDRIAKAEGLQVSVRALARVAPEVFDETCVTALEKAAQHLGYSHQRMISGAAHDAQILAGRFPAAMIFVPSKDGISHNIKEYTKPAHIEAGANVLLHAVLDLASATTLSC
ncbi:MAG: Zn-dependent hydrolase [Rhodothermales bacterium]